ncbi:MAG: tetratricopeptide repeat protein [Acetobacteraceae bacterium]
MPPETPVIAADRSSGPDPDDLVRSARSLLRAGRPGAARPLIAALKRLRPAGCGMPLLESELAEAEGRIPDAIAALAPAFSGGPAEVGLLKRRAGLLHQAGDASAAIRDAAEAVITAPRDAGAKALLGLLLMENGDSSAALTCLADAVAADPENVEFRLGSAEAAARSGDAARAAHLLEEGIARAPGRADLREAAIRAALRRDDPAKAENLATEALAAGLASASIFRFLGEAAVAQGRGGEAAKWLAEALKLDPADAALRHMAAATGALPPPERAPPEAVRARFESAAPGFARAMIAAGDRVPGLIRAAVLAHVPLPQAGKLGPVLDLGCGSGMAAIALSDLPLGPFVGLDLSPAMLSAAREWGLYADLVEADLADFLAADERGLPLILAADVLTWFGPLRSVFGAVERRLAPGGRFILSLEAMPAERLDTRGWELRPDGSYAHAEALCEGSARDAGLRVIDLRRETLRVENGVPVAGLLAVLARSNDDD